MKYNPDKLHEQWDKQIDVSNADEWLRFTFPRQNKGKFLGISDFFKDKNQMNLM